MMKNLAFLPLLLLSTLALEAQEIPRFQKYPFSDSGFEVYLPASPEEVEEMLTEDGSRMWTGEVIFNDLNYVIICAQFNDPLGDEADEQVALLESYLDFLQTQFGIDQAAGYGRGHTLESDPSLNGVLDYWVDAEGFEWSVKGWVNAHYIAVLAVGGWEGAKNPNIDNFFLNGIRFPK